MNLANYSNGRYKLAMGIAEKLDYNLISEKGDADMCTVFEETRKEGVAQGITQGRTDFL